MTRQLVDLPDKYVVDIKDNIPATAAFRALGTFTERLPIGTCTRRIAVDGKSCLVRVTVHDLNGFTHVTVEHVDRR